MLATTSKRVTHLKIKGSSCQIPGSKGPGTVPEKQWEVVLWQSLDLCVSAEERRSSEREKGKESANNTITTDTSLVQVSQTDAQRGNSRSALMTLDFNGNINLNASTTPSNNFPILVPLTTKYAQLTSQLDALHIAGNKYDESANLLSAIGGVLQHLRALSFRFCGLTSMAGLLGCAPQLQKLDVYGCRKLRSLKGLEQGHENLRTLTACATGIATLQELEACPGLERVDFDNCSRLSSLSGLEGHVWLEEIRLSKTAITTLAPFLQQDAPSPSLRKIDVGFCQQLTSLDVLGQQGHDKLEEVIAPGTPIQSLQFLNNGHCPRLKVVDVGACRQVMSLDGLQGHRHLETVIATNTGIASICELLSCSSLKTLWLDGCRRVTSLGTLAVGDGGSAQQPQDSTPQWPYLEELSLSDMPITSLGPLKATCASLKRLDVSNCEQLASLEGVESHIALTELFAEETPIKDLLPLEKCLALQKLSCRNCSQLQSLEGLENHRNLTELTASYTNIPSLRGLEGAVAIKKIEVQYSQRLDSLEGLTSGHANEHHIEAYRNASGTIGMPQLEEINLSGTALTSLSALHEGFPSLKRVIVERCRMLQWREEDLPGVSVEDEKN